MGDTTGGADLVINQPGLVFDKSKTLNNTSTGPKYLVISRKADPLKADLSLKDVSPFLIKKVIDSTCGGEVELCKKLKNGTLLIQTKNRLQALKLIQLKSLSHTIEIEVTEHNSLNSSKGVIYSNDLRGISNEAILEELKHQGVEKVEKILKKVDNNLSETGLTILTFASISLPENINIGYEKVKIRPYIPRPLRCNNCFSYGHSAKFCKNNKLCPNCSCSHHTNFENNELCTNIKLCVNCKTLNPENAQHTALDRNCPIFIKEKEVQAIITMEKTNRFRALTIYKERHPHNNQSYASIAKNNVSVANGSSTPSKLNTPSNSSNNTARKIIDYSETIFSNDDILASQSTQITPKAPISILPRGISKRTRRLLKKKNYIDDGAKKRTRALDLESSDTASMDLDPQDPDE